jgi:cell fate regulator YaaT (PSP1 superfamily)
MAKLQRATLDPSKISGRCGRLKCCLRYEYDTYQELQRELPSVGSEIVTNQGRARVLAQEILAAQLLIETEDMRRIMIPASDVLTVLKRGKQSREERRQPADGAPPDEEFSEQQLAALADAPDESGEEGAADTAIEADEAGEGFDDKSSKDDELASETD